MLDKEKIFRDQAGAVELMNKRVDADISSQQRTSRDTCLHLWDEDSAHKIDTDEGIDLSDEHWQVVHTLRGFFREHGPADSGRNLSEMLDQAFANQSCRTYPHLLFPAGPVRQGMGIAGLPVSATPCMRFRYCPITATTMTRVLLKCRTTMEKPG